MNRTRGIAHPPRDVIQPSVEEPTLPRASIKREQGRPAVVRVLAKQDVRDLPRGDGTVAQVATEIQNGFGESRLGLGGHTAGEDTPRLAIGGGADRVVDWKAFLQTGWQVVGGSPYGHGKTTIYLPSGLQERLRGAARREGRSRAQIVREAIEERLDRDSRDGPSIFGMFDELPAVTSDDVKSKIREEWDSARRDHPRHLCGARDLNSQDPNHDAAAAAGSSDGGLVIPMGILSEIGCMIERWMSQTHLARFLDRLAAGALNVRCGDGDLPRIGELVLRYASLPLGFSDAAVVACAETTGGRVLTFDRRDFRCCGPGRRDRLGVTRRESGPADPCWFARHRTV